MKKAFGAIDLLVGLLITTAILMVCVSSFKKLSIQQKNVDTRTIKEQVDAQVNEIEQIRQQSIDIQNDILKNEAQ